MRERLRSGITGIIKWDNATIDLGWYIGALATEHYMLSHSELFPGYASGDSSALNQVGNELYHALSALDRVDAVAEASFNPSAPDTPGFFIRDDVRSTFHSHFPGMTAVVSDFTDPKGWASSRRKKPWYSPLWASSEHGHKALCYRITTLSVGC